MQFLLPMLFYQSHFARYQHWRHYPLVLLAQKRNGTTTGWHSYSLHWHCCSNRLRPFGSRVYCFTCHQWALEEKSTCSLRSHFRDARSIFWRWWIQQFPAGIPAADCPQQQWYPSQTSLVSLGLAMSDWPNWCLAFVGPIFLLFSLMKPSSMNGFCTPVGGLGFWLIW